MDDKQLDQAAKEGWITKKQRDNINSRKYLTYLATNNKKKNHKPQASLSTEQWAAKQKTKKSPNPKKKKKTSTQKRKVRNDYS